MAATLPFREALNRGIVSGTLVDTKIILFSRRDSSNRVYGPRSLYASSHVLKSVPYFNDRESVVSTSPPSNELTGPATPKVLFGNFLEAELRDFSDDVGSHESTAEDYGYFSDSDLEDDDNEPARSTPARDESNATSPRPPHCPADEEQYFGNHSELAKKGKIVKVPDIAFVT